MCYNAKPDRDDQVQSLRMYNDMLEEVARKAEEVKTKMDQYDNENLLDIDVRSSLLDLMGGIENVLFDIDQSQSDACLDNFRTHDEQLEYEEELEQARKEQEIYESGVRNMSGQY